ncbi:hypothetical protein FRC03_010772 [Tulasnella sp. 419]|nr:hypothetical protein FRC03_010772 [Tulasnella sp. 419]
MASNDDASLIDITFQRLQLVISGQSLLEPEQLSSTLAHRKDKLKNPSDPYPPPSNASKSKIESGRVKLADDSVIQVEEEHKDHVFKISQALDIDQIDALIIFRGFILNEGLPSDFSPENQSLVEAVTGFYFDERIAIMQCVSSLLNLKDHNVDDVNHSMAAEFLPEIVPDQLQLAKDIVAAIAERTTRPLPRSVLADPRTAARWAKQNLREQLCLLEILFAASYPLNCDGDLVYQLYEALYKTDLGMEQKYSYLMLDEACGRLRQDIQSLFLVVAVQVLKLDKLLDEPLDLELVTKSQHGYLASPDRVEAIHNLIFKTPLDNRYSPLLLAWGFVLTKLTEVIVAGDIPDDYSSFASVINPTPSRRGGHRQPVEPPSLTAGEEFISGAMERQFLETMLLLLRSPLLSTAAHSTLSSSISEPNNGAYRYVLKC